ncbi:MAG: HAMP domain-containing histidine kinase [Gemmatimonadota bacterium]|nr:MAG: HAMP domain-containing histidine kinase [Gemmatimonadota bacterium]
MKARKLAAALRRAGPEIVLTLVAIFVGVSLWQAWAVVSHLRVEAREASRIYARITAALADPEPSGDTETLFELVSEITGSGIPLIVTDTFGQPTAVANLPFELKPGDTRLSEYVRNLDQANPPIAVPGIGQLHFGAHPAQRRLTRLTFLQLGLLIAAIAVGVWAYRSAVTRDRDRLWVAMARESAHQLGTPLMSAGAWVDRLEGSSTPAPEIAGHLRSDLERLHRVAQRFERIGRPAHRDRVGLGTIAERIAAYFEPRLPRHAHSVVIVVDAPAAGPAITGDAVLIEWALEALVRNGVDALSGRGGMVRITVEDKGDRARITVSDDGPGIPAEVRANLFEPGVTTKSGGWGIGLALARRIVEDVHGGHIDIAPSGTGAVFVADLPVAGEGELGD